MSISSPELLANVTKREELQNELLAKGSRFIAPRGNPRAPVWIIGEAGGEQEEKEGYAFVGPSGKEQDRMLSDSGFQQSEIYFTNPYKVRPPDNKLPRLGELGIASEVYLDEFFEELRQFRPPFIITCGKTPTQLLCPATKPQINRKTTSEDSKKDNFGKFRGSLLASPELSWPHYVVPIYHPAFVLRNWSERPVSVLIYSKVREEFSWWRTHGQQHQPLPERKITIEPSETEIVERLTEIYDKKTRVSVDIEMVWSRKPKHRLVFTIAFATSPGEAFSFCIWDYSTFATRSIMRVCNQVLLSCPIIGQNFIGFDSHWLRTIGLDVDVRKVSDTLIRHHVLWPEFEHNLGFMSMQYTRQPFFKEDGKKWTFKNKAPLMRYNCMDAMVTYEVWLEQEKEFDARR